MKTVLMYGDSNTWGYDWTATDPREFRFARDVRWTGLVQRALGDGYLVVEEGLGGRTTVFDDPSAPGRNGLAFLQTCMQSHQPLDLIVFMLGTNDVNALFGVPATEVARGMEALLKTALNPMLLDTKAAPQVLVIAPFYIKDCGKYGSIDRDAERKSRELGPLYEQLAAAYGCHFLDIGPLIAPHPDEGLHLGAEGHRELAALVTGKVREIFGEG